MFNKGLPQGWRAGLGLPIVGSLIGGAIGNK